MLGGAIIGSISAPVGGPVAKLFVKTHAVVLRGMIAGLSSGAANQIIHELLAFVSREQELTGTVLCHAGVRVVVSSFSGLVTGGLVANVRITKPCGKIVGVPITRSTAILVPLEQRTSELIIPGASGVGGASILGDWIAVIANLEGLVCGDE